MNLAWTEMKGSSTDPAHFEGLKSEIHVGFMDTAEMAVEGRVEGV